MEFRGYFIFVQEYGLAAPLLCNAPYSFALQRNCRIGASFRLYRLGPFAGALEEMRQLNVDSAFMLR
jgi:hypothetical protein